MVRGRPEKLTDSLKRTIASIRIKYPKWTLAEIQAELRQLLNKSIKGSNPTWSNGDIASEVSQKLPGISAIQKYIKVEEEPNKNNAEYIGIDTPWHLGTLKDYTLSAEAISYILAVERWAKDKNEKPLTIRHALWVSRLYHTFGKLPLKEKALSSLWGYSGGYAWYEYICEISGTDFDTTLLDEALIGLRNWHDAVSMLSLEHGIFTPEAFSWLIKQSQSKNQEIRESAEEMIAIITHPIIKQKEGEK